MQNNATLTCHFACQMGAVGNRHSTRRLTEGHKCDPYGGHLTISNKITNTHNLSQRSPFQKCTIQMLPVAWARSFTVTVWNSKSGNPSVCQQRDGPHNSHHSCGMGCYRSHKRSDHASGTETKGPP